MKRNQLIAISILVIIWCFIGCASKDRLSNVSEKQTLQKTTDDTNEHEQRYDFRKTRWGFHAERVRLLEAQNGMRPYKKTRELLIYRVTIKGVKCRLIYTFKDNKLRTAGYVTIEPTRNAETLMKVLLDLHGKPDTDTTDAIVWKGNNSVVWTNGYISVIQKSLTRYEYTSGGLLVDVLRQEIAEREKEGQIAYFDGVIGYVDRKFYDALVNREIKLSDLSRYEKELMGIIQKSGQTIVPGIGRIPN